MCLTMETNTFQYFQTKKLNENMFPKDKYKIYCLQEHGRAVL